MEGALTGEPSLPPECLIHQDERGRRGQKVRRGRREGMDVPGGTSEVHGSATARKLGGAVSRQPWPQVAAGAGKQKVRLEGEQSD